MDNVNHPQHYEGSTSIECIDAMRLIFGDSSVTDFCLCNAFKYLWRHKNKNGIEDLDKATWYLKEARKLNKASYNEDKMAMLKELIRDAYNGYTEATTCTGTTD